MIRVLVVDDSETMRALLTKALEASPDIHVVGTARDGREAVKRVGELRPDLVTMDVRMPVMDGFRATEGIMSSFPVPIVIVTKSLDAPDLNITFNALRAGAVDVLEKPSSGAPKAEFEKFSARLVGTVRLMSEVKVVQRRSAPAPVVAVAPRMFSLVAIGASTGGPQVINRVLKRLPPRYALPVVLAQHMAPGFTRGFAHWLQGECEVRVKMAEDGEPLASGTVYIAPDELHLRVDREWRVRLGSDAPMGLFRPSIDALFRSVAEVAGESAVGVLLSGLGSDGAQGLLAIKQAGGWALAQDGESCVVNGMPDAARRLGAVSVDLPPDSLATLIAGLERQR